MRGTRAGTRADGERTGPIAAGELDVLIPTCGRPEALAVTLAGLANQTVRAFRIVLSDQTPDRPAVDAPAVVALLHQLRRQGSAIELHRGRPPRGIAEQRQFLLDRAVAENVLYLDDDVFLEAATAARLLAAIRELGCGFVGAAPVGLSYLDDVRPQEQRSYEPISGQVTPERVRKGDPAWNRWTLHNAANLTHLADRVHGADRVSGGRAWSAYRVAWVFGCVLYDRAALEAAGGFRFWRRLPAAHRGEEIVAQLRVMERAGGVGLLPPGAVHLELPTSVVDRDVDAYAAIIEADDRRRRPERRLPGRRRSGRERSGRERPDGETSAPTARDQEGTGERR